MNSFENGVIIGIDRGASFTDFGIVESEHLIDCLSLESRDWGGICDVYDRLAAKYKNHRVAFTGAVTGMPAELKERIRIISEIDAIGFGGATLAGCRTCIVVSIGTGSAVVHFTDNRAKHVGGTGMGGGTIKGLAALICGIDDPVKIEAQALKGNAAQVNLTISDLGYNSLSFLGADLTASNFACLKSRRIEDLAAAITRLVGESVGIIASICAREAGCMDKIVAIGKVAQNKFIRQTLKLVGKLYQTSFIFPDNPGYATVFGTAIKYRHDMMNQENKD